MAEQPHHSSHPGLGRLSKSEPASLGTCGTEIIYYLLVLYCKKKKYKGSSRVCACGPVIEPLQEIGSKPRACPPSNRVTQDKSLQRQRITQYLQFQATECATHVRTLLWILLKQNVKCACGCANASFPLQLYKWERSPTSQIGSLTPPKTAQ